MNNCIILGFGRSGTSLLGGLLFNSGYFAGNHLHPPRPSNPKGFFEDIIINRINELILEGYDYSNRNTSYQLFSKKFSPFSPRRGQRWLTWIEPGTLIEINNENIESEIRNAIVKQNPFAYKDPRFIYTLPVWIKYLPGETKYICIFRDPSAVVQSVMLECNSMEYMKDFYVDVDLAYKLWYNNYRHLLDSMTPELLSKTLFVSYEGLIRGNYLDKISQLLNVQIKNDFIEPSLNRSEGVNHVPLFVSDLYKRLLDLSY